MWTSQYYIKVHSVTAIKLIVLKHSVSKKTSTPSSTKNFLNGASKKAQSLQHICIITFRKHLFLLMLWYQNYCTWFLKSGLKSPQFFIYLWGKLSIIFLSICYLNSLNLQKYVYIIKEIYFELIDRVPLEGKSISCFVPTSQVTVAMSEMRTYSS